MSTPIPARDLRNKYRQIIDRVRGGERITIVTDGVPVVDLIPHVTDTAPPRFRSADDQPQWTPLSDRTAAEWAVELRGLDNAIDHAPSDPWERP